MEDKNLEMLMHLSRNKLDIYSQFVQGFKPARHHRIWLHKTQQLFAGELEKRRILFISPPGFAKTTYESIIAPTWYLGNNPANSLIFFTNSDNRAVTVSRGVVNTLDKNIKHNSVFSYPECQPDKSRGWNQEVGYFLAGLPPISTAPSYQALGFYSSILGSRADGIILDDPLTQGQSKSAKEQQRAIENFEGTVDSRLKPNGWMIAIMNRWHTEDLASYILAKAKDLHNWEVILMPALGFWDDHGLGMLKEALGDLPNESFDKIVGDLENSGSLWPEYYQTDHLLEIKREKGGPVFAALWQGNPLAAGGGEIFKEEWFRPLPDDFTHKESASSISIREQLSLVQYWDIAYSERESADYSVCATIGFDPSLNFYLLNIHREKLTPNRLVDAVIEQYRSWSPTIVGMEYTSYKKGTIVDIARRVTEKYNVPLKLDDPRKRGDKVARAQMPAARAEAGKFYSDTTAPWWADFITEMLEFPDGHNDDQTDAVSGAVAMITGNVTNRKSKIQISKYNFGIQEPKGTRDTVFTDVFLGNERRVGLEKQAQRVARRRRKIKVRN